MEYETIKAEIRDGGNGTNVITIPQKVMNFTGWKKGEWLYIQARKIKPTKKKQQ